MTEPEPEPEHGTAVADRPHSAARTGRPGLAAPAGRVACLAVLLFPLAARLRSEPELAGEAVVVCEGNGNAARVLAATRLARAAGVRPGQTLPQARALCAKLVARARDEVCERSAQEALLEAAEAFSPRVEDAGPGIAYVDLHGLERRLRGRGHGSEAEADPELHLGRCLIAAAAAAGLPARVGIAGSKLAARVAAAGPETPVVVPAGDEAGFLAPLPLDRLTPEVDVAATLERWGVRSIGDFAKLPRAKVASRLGEAGRALHATARGFDPQPLVPREMPPEFQEGTTLEWPIVALEPFLFVGRPALERLCERLESRGLACVRLELDLRLEPDGTQRRSLDLPAPTHDAKTLLTLVRLELEARPPGAPVAGFTFSARPDRPREAQLSLYGPAALSPDKLATTLARLFALLGPDRAGSPRPAEGHSPERFALVDFQPPPPPPVRREPRAGRGLLAVRALRPPLTLEVLTANGDPGPEAPPVELRTLVGEEEAKRPRLQGRVKVASGPWGLEEEWWAESPTGRDYWDVELEGSGIYRIFRDRASGSWYADGIYD